MQLPEDLKNVGVGAADESGGHVQAVMDEVDRKLMKAQKEARECLDNLREQIDNDWEIRDGEKDEMAMFERKYDHAKMETTGTLGAWNKIAEAGEAFKKKIDRAILSDMKYVQRRSRAAIESQSLDSTKMGLKNAKSGTKTCADPAVPVDTESRVSLSPVDTVYQLAVPVDNEIVIPSPINFRVKEKVKVDEVIYN